MPGWPQIRADQTKFIPDQEDLAGIKNIPEASLKKSHQLAELEARVPEARQEESPGWNHYVYTPAMVNSNYHCHSSHLLCLGIQEEAAATSSLAALFLNRPSHIVSN